MIKFKAVTGLTLGCAALLAGGLAFAATQPATPAPGAATPATEAPAEADEGTEAAAGPALFTAEQAERGQQAFDANCAACHGPEVWTGSVGQDAAGVHSFMRTSMPMGNPGSLSASAYIDIMAYFLAGNGYSAGEEALTRDALDGLTIESFQ